MMTAMKPVLDFVFDANVVFFVAFGLWALTHYALSNSRWKDDYSLQLRLLRIVFICVILSPFLSFASVTLSHAIWASAPFTVSDLAVAAYLRGDIAIPAVQFEEILNTRSRIFDAVLAGELPWMTAIACAFRASALDCSAYQQACEAKLHLAPHKNHGHSPVGHDLHPVCCAWSVSPACRSAF